jgi:ABC-2 type transport system permease protein
MRSIKAIFKKQLKDTFNNLGVLIQFIIFPAVAFAMTQLVARGNENIPDTMFITMMAAIFVGMALIPAVAGIIAEDRERQSLRFLVMAGVKPAGYLMGIGSVIFAASLLPSLAFALMGRFSGTELWLFMAVMMSGVVASTILGLTIGIYAKNQQAAIGLAMPVAMVLGFAPMVATFNEPMMRVTRFFYTQQIDIVLNSFYSVGGYQALTNFWESFGIIGANIAVLVVLFVVAFAKKGLKG